MLNWESHQDELENLQLSLLRIVWDQIDRDDSVLGHREMLAVLLILEGEKKVRFDTQNDGFYT